VTAVPSASSTWSPLCSAPRGQMTQWCTPSSVTRLKQPLSSTVNVPVTGERSGVHALRRLDGQPETAPPRRDNRVVVLGCRALAAAPGEHRDQRTRREHPRRTRPDPPALAGRRDLLPHPCRHRSIVGLARERDKARTVTFRH
jgi:hypothetical protein